MVGEELLLAAPELYGAPELVQTLIDSINGLANVLRATGAVIALWITVSVYRFWVTKREYKLLKILGQDMGKIKRKLKVK
ncbi:hypothetical protein ACFLZZ_04280 [Nanoarchaeota archaeon]